MRAVPRMPQDEPLAGQQFHMIAERTMPIGNMVRRVRTGLPAGEQVAEQGLLP